MIAQQLHSERSFSRLSEELGALRQQCSQQANQIRELFARDEVSASKAELHAVMASLTYKDRVAVTNNALGSSIQKIFQGHHHGQSPSQQSMEIQTFLSNPYETIAVLSDKLTKMEIQQAEDKISMSREIEKLQGELGRARKESEDINFQFFKLQTAMSKASKFHHNSQPQVPRKPTLLVVDSNAPAKENTDNGVDIAYLKESAITRHGRTAEPPIDLLISQEKDIDEEDTDDFMEEKDTFPPSSSIPMQSEIPSRERSSTIRYPSKDNGPILQRLSDLEVATEKRLSELEKNDSLVKQLLTTVSVLNSEHTSLHLKSTEFSAQLKGQKDFFQSIIQHVVNVVEKNSKRVDGQEKKSEQGRDNHQVLCRKVDDIRRDLLCIVQETMREAKPDEQGVVFKSICLSTADQSSEIVPVSMMSKDIVGSDDMKIMVDGLKKLDSSFQQKLMILEKLTNDQDSLSHNLREVEDSLQKLKYLVLHSIQLPTKSNAAPREDPHPPKTLTKSIRPLEGFEVKLDRPVSSSVCHTRDYTGSTTAATSPHFSDKKRSHTAPNQSQLEPASVRFNDNDFFEGGNFEVAENCAGVNEKDMVQNGPQLQESRLKPSCPTVGRSSKMNTNRAKRTQRVDLVKGIATVARKKGGTPSTSTGVSEQTLRNLSIEWSANSAAKLKSDDWSRTVDSIHHRQRKSYALNGKAHVSVDEAVDTSRIEQSTSLLQSNDVGSVLIDSSSKDFLSIMSSITDVDL